MSHSLVDMLPKDGTGAVDDYRPIVLLSVLYRPCVKSRGPPVMDWMRMAGTPLPDGPRAAEALAA